MKKISSEYQISSDSLLPTFNMLYDITLIATGLAKSAQIRQELHILCLCAERRGLIKSHSPFSEKIYWIGFG